MCSAVFFTALLFGTPHCAFATMGKVWLGVPLPARQNILISSQKTPADAYAIHAYSDEANIQVIEYVNIRGLVFAVQWSGASLPNFDNLLSDQYVKSLSENKGQFTTRYIFFEKQGFAFKSAGRLRSFKGYAYDVKLMPSNFDIGVLQ